MGRIKLKSPVPKVKASEPLCPYCHEAVENVQMFQRDMENGGILIGLCCDKCNTILKIDLVKRVEKAQSPRIIKTVN